MPENSGIFVFINEEGRNSDTLELRPDGPFVPIAA